MQWDRIKEFTWVSEDLKEFDLELIVERLEEFKVRSLIIKPSTGVIIKSYEEQNIKEAMHKVVEQALEIAETLKEEKEKEIKAREDSGLGIVYKGLTRSFLNKSLLDSQGCWENLEKIKKLHVKILELEDKMNSENDKYKLMVYDEQYTELEFQLQDAWKFERNVNFHRFWNRPKCVCPKLDNNDRYPVGWYIKVDNCPLHGEF